MGSLLSLDTTFVVAAFVTVAFMVIYPVVLGTVAHKRLHVGWRYFAFGAIVFLLSQGLSRIPLVQLIQAQITPRLQSCQWRVWIWLVCLAVSAGVFEEVGRCLDYRLFMRRESRTWGKAVMLGLDMAASNRWC